MDEVCNILKKILEELIAIKEAINESNSPR